MTGERQSRFALLFPALLLAISMTACGSAATDQPGDASNATATPGIQRLLTTDLEEFSGWITQALADRDFEALPPLMRDPFDLHVYGAGGSQRPPTSAVDRMLALFPPEGTVIECGGEPPQDALVPLGMTYTEYYEQSYGVLFCTGWGPDGVGESIILIDLDDAGFLYWIEINAALNGFAGASR